MAIEQIANTKIDSLKNHSNPVKTVDKSKVSVDKVEPAQIGRSSTGTGKHGGARPGAGRKPGRMNRKTIEKLAVKKEFEERVARQAHKLLSAQLSVALGTQYLFVRYKIKTIKGWRWSKFERVEDPDIMQAYLDGELKDRDYEYYMLTAEKPDVNTIDSLLDRAFGKAPQSLNISDDRPDPIATILAKFGLLEEEGDSNHAGQIEGSTSTPSQSVS